MVTERGGDGEGVWSRRCTTTVSLLRLSTSIVIDGSDIPLSLGRYSEPMCRGSTSGISRVMADINSGAGMAVRGDCTSTCDTPWTSCKCSSGRGISSGAGGGEIGNGIVNSFFTGDDLNVLFTGDILSWGRSGNGLLPSRGGGSGSGLRSRGDWDRKGD